MSMRVRMALQKSLLLLLLSLLWYQSFLFIALIERAVHRIDIIEISCRLSPRSWRLPCAVLLENKIRRSLLLWEYEVIKPLKLSVLKERMSASIEQIWNIVASLPKFVFTPTFIFCSPICSNNCSVVFLEKFIWVFEKWFFSFDRSNMQIFTVNITRVVWPHVTIPLDLRHFCWHNTSFYHLNLLNIMISH